MPDVLKVRVACTQLPGLTFRDGRDPVQPVKTPVFVGIQLGKEVVEAVPANRRTAAFDAEFRVLPAAGGATNFLGPFAQGTPDDRFFYLCWGVQEAGEPFAMFRRLKVRLSHLKWTVVKEAVRSGRPITVHLRLTDAKGGPLCATPPTSHIWWEVDAGGAEGAKRGRPTRPR